MDEVVSFFQVCHAADQSLHEQRQQKITAKKECKEPRKGCCWQKMRRFCKNNSSRTGNNKSEKLGCTENLCCYCKLDGYNVTWNSCSCHNFWHPNYSQPSGLSANCSWDKSSRDCDKYCNMRNFCCSWSRSCDQHDHRDRDCKPAACDLKGQSCHAKHFDRSRSRTWSQSRSRSCDSWSPRHDHCHYIHHDDYWERKQECSPVALPCSRSICRPSTPWAKSPPVQYQDPIVELKTTASPQQNNEAVPEYAARTKIQWVPCATYPVPPPSPDSYNGMMAKTMMMIMTFLSTM